MFSRAYQMTKAYRERQGAFDFAAVALVVLDLAIETKKRLIKAAKETLRKILIVAPATIFKKPHQLVLELDSIVQIPFIL